MSQLPKLKTPQFTVTMKDGKTINYQMMTKKDEKALLYTEESKDKNTIINAIADIVENRTNGAVNPRKDPKWLIEYLFILIRKDSIEPVISLQLPRENNTPLPAIIDLTKATVNYSENEFTGIVDLSEFSDDALKVEFREPLIYDYLVNPDGDSEEQSLDLLWNSFKAIYHGSETIDKDSLKKEEFIEWVDDLTSPAFGKINEAFENINKVEYILEYDGKEQRLHDILNFLITG